MATRPWAPDGGPIASSSEIRRERSSRRRSCDEVQASSEEECLGGRKSRRMSKNCAECRRMKVKCDRNIPCGRCVKRGYSHVCPNGTFGGAKGLLEDRQSLLDRIGALETGAERSSNSPNPASCTERSTSANAATLPRLSPARPPMDYAGHAVRALQSTSAGSRAGTLVTFPGQVSKYVGPSAASQWLREEAQDQPSTAPWRSTPTQTYTATSNTSGDPPADNNSTAYSLPLAGIGSSAFSSSYDSLYGKLPPYSEAVNIVNVYFRHIAWLSTPIIEEDMYPILQTTYRIMGTLDTPQYEAYHELALVFAVLGLGTLANTEVEPLHSKSMVYFDAAQQCLVAGRFLLVNTFPALQALFILNRLLAYSDMPWRWDLAWQLWGTAARLAQAMGLHKDGEVWKLEPKELERRRLIFWEIFITDIHMSRQWDRPSAIQIDQFDTRMPVAWGEAGATFHSCRARLAVVTKEVLDSSMSTKSSTYSDIRAMWRRTHDIEGSIPMELRCRAAMMVQASRYATVQTAIDASPDPALGDLQTSLRRHDLVVNVTAVIYLLLRPYYVAALRESPKDPTRSSHGQAFMAVFERSGMMVAMLQSLYTLHPLVSVRHWFFWSATITATVSLALVCIVSPRSPLSAIALRDIETVNTLLPAARQLLGKNNSRDRDVKWVQQLRDKAHAAVHAATPPDGPQTATASHIVGDTSALQQRNPEAHEIRQDTETQFAAAGWTTRLIRRLWTDMSDLSADTESVEPHMGGVSASQLTETTSGPSLPTTAFDGFWSDVSDWPNGPPQDLAGPAGQPHMTDSRDLVNQYLEQATLSNSAGVLTQPAAFGDDWTQMLSFDQAIASNLGTDPGILGLAGQRQPYGQDYTASGEGGVGEDSWPWFNIFTST